MFLMKSSCCMVLTSNITINICVVTIKHIVYILYRRRKKKKFDNLKYSFWKNKQAAKAER